MNDPADQTASDEAIKRTTNLTPTSFRQSLNQTAIDFQRRIDAQAAAPVLSTTRQPPQITTSETKLDGQPVTLPLQDNSQNPFPHNTTPTGGITADIVVCVSDGGSPPVYTQKTASFINGLLMNLA
jgi:hypothetical protein